MSDCIHEMAPGTCSYCKPKPPKTELDHWTVASFDSSCYECDEEIVEGDPIAHNGDGWVSTCCATESSAESDFA